MLSRVGISLEDSLLEMFDEQISKRGYTNRSEAVRDLIRDSLIRDQWEDAADDETRVGVLCLVFDHEEHELSCKLTHAQHDHHEVVVSTMHIHMDRRNCLEVIVLRGAAGEVMRAADSLVATRGVKLGKLIPATTGKGL
jgi:CopG family transcriptional regulator, nickel-responsive regulator